MTKLVYLLMVCALAALGQPNFSGVWKPESGDQLIKIDQQSSGIDFSIHAPNNSVTLHAVFGKETSNNIGGLPAVVVAEWDGGTLVLRIHATNNGTTVAVTDRYTLSSDGSRLNGEEIRKIGDQPEVKQTSAMLRRPAEEWNKDLGLEPAESVYKNIQLLKGQNTREVQDFMRRITVALGVGCAHCHADHMDSDEKPAKVTARKMITMVRAIDTQNFPQSNAVTCWTCHRGALKPESAKASAKP